MTLHMCPDCDSDLVQPLDSERMGYGIFNLLLWCPDCHWLHETSVPYTDLQAFERELQRGRRQLQSLLDDLSRMNMQEDLERLTRALDADAVLPEDF